MFITLFSTSFDLFMHAFVEHELNNRGGGLDAQLVRFGLDHFFIFIYVLPPTWHIGVETKTLNENKYHPSLYTTSTSDSITLININWYAPFKMAGRGGIPITHTQN